jgi:histidinol-phosphatase (PHP family)
VIVDYHMHLRDRPGGEAQGRYGVDRAEEYVEQARSAGVDEIGFTDHVYHFRQSESLWEIGWMRERCTDDLDEYVGAVDEAKRRGLPVKLGLEVDYFPGIERELAALLEPYPWDYLLGSVHFVDGFPVVLSHPDLIKFFGPRPDPEQLHYIHVETADTIEAAGLCVEVSSAGLHKPVAEVYPDRELLAACHDRGVPITTASDAHEPAHVGRDLDRAVEQAREAGYDTVTVFDRRERRQESLG